MLLFCDQTSATRLWFYTVPVHLFLGHILFVVTIHTLPYLKRIRFVSVRLSHLTFKMH